MSIEEIRAGLRDGTLAICLPAAHENFASSFLEEFSERILKQSWCDVATRTHLKIPALLDEGETEEDAAAAIQFEYGTEISDLSGMPFWEVVRRCARHRVPAARS